MTSRTLAGASVVLLSRILTFPRSPWELDEFLFLQAVRDFEPLRHHPHPPGYPLFVGFGKAVTAIVGSPFVALVAISIAAAVAGYVALERAFRTWTGDDDLATAGALLFFLSSGMLIHSSLAMSDSLAICCLAFAFAALAAPRDGLGTAAAVVSGAAAAAAIGCRPQLALPLLPALAVGLVLFRTWRLRLVATAAFTLVCLAWFIPLVVETGGWSGFVEYQLGQARYVAAHDAALSRGARSMLRLTIRFGARAWGSEATIAVVGLLAVAGLARLVRSRHPSLLPFIQFSLLHLVFAILVMDPADAVRYSLPAMPLVALLAAHGLGVLRDLTRFRLFPAAATLAIVVLSAWYVAPILIDRVTAPSPVVRAAELIRTRYPRDTVVLYPAGMRPHADWLLPDYPRRHLEEAMAGLAASPETPAVMLVEGHAAGQNAMVFSWRESAAWARMTRTFGRQISVDPLRPEERFEPVEGVYALEGAAGLRPWRWLSPLAHLRLPSLRTDRVVLTLGLVPEAPYETAHVNVRAGGKRIPVEVTKQSPVLVVVRHFGRPDIWIDSSESYRPAEVLHNQDERLLAVQLLGLEQQ